MSGDAVLVFGDSELLEPRSRDAGLSKHLWS